VCCTCIYSVASHVVAVLSSILACQHHECAATNQNHRCGRYDRDMLMRIRRTHLQHDVHCQTRIEEVVEKLPLYVKTCLGHLLLIVVSMVIRCCYYPSPPRNCLPLSHSISSFCCIFDLVFSPLMFACLFFPFLPCLPLYICALDTLGFALQRFLPVTPPLSAHSG
jgi:hypothetical protein